MKSRPHPLPPELLDSVDPESEQARAGRRDLRRVNLLMGNQRWIVSELKRRQAPISCSQPVLELGSGDGSQLRYYQTMPNLRVHGLDLAPRPPQWPETWSWTQANFLQQALPPASVVIASLVLHHFEAKALQQLGQQLAQASLLLFVEPLRRKRHLLQGRLLHPFIHPLTRHDLALSVRAGFVRGELAAALGLKPQEWTIREQLHPLGGLRFAAQRLNPNYAF